MADNIFGAAIQGASNIAGALLANADSKAARKWQAEQAEINRDFQRDERLATQEYNLDMWNLTNEWNLEQWHRQNEYDSPEAQLERARAAGINPNTAIASMYGGGSASLSASPVSSSPMSGSMASYSDGLANSIMSSFSQLGVNTANMLNTLADKNTKQYWLSYDQMTEEQRKHILERTADNLLKDISLKDVNVDTAKVVLGNLAEMKEQELLNLRKLGRQIDISTASTYESIQRDNALAESTMDVNQSMASLNNSKEELTDEQTKSVELVNEFTKAVGAPLGTPEYQFCMKLAKQGKLEQFISGVYEKLERAKWKPQDYYYTTENDVDEDVDNTIKLGPINLGIKGAERKRKRRTNKASFGLYSFPVDSTIVNSW